MDFLLYMECMRKKYNVQSDKVEIQAIFRKYPEIDPNDLQIDPENEDSRPLLHLAIEEEMEEVVEFILKEAPIKADPNLVDLKTELTPLCAALQQSLYYIV